MITVPHARSHWSAPTKKPVRGGRTWTRGGVFDMRGACDSPRTAPASVRKRQTLVNCAASSPASNWSAQRLVRIHCPPSGDAFDRCRRRAGNILCSRGPIIGILRDADDISCGAREAIGPWRSLAGAARRRASHLHALHGGCVFSHGVSPPRARSGGALASRRRGRIGGEPRAARSGSVLRRRLPMVEPGRQASVVAEPHAVGASARCDRDQSGACRVVSSARLPARHAYTPARSAASLLSIF